MGVREKCDEKRAGRSFRVRTFPHPPFAKCAKDGHTPSIVHASEIRGLGHPPPWRGA